MEKETEVAEVFFSFYPPLESSVLCEERMSQRFGCRDANVGTEGQTLLQEERGQRKIYICTNECCDMIKVSLSECVLLGVKKTETQISSHIAGRSPRGPGCAAAWCRSLSAPS